MQDVCACHRAGVPFASVDWVGAGEPTLQKQRGKWVIRQIGYDPATGRRRVRQLDTFDTRRAAQAQLRALIDGRLGTEGETLSQFLEQVWLPSKLGRIEVGTYDQYHWAVRLHIVPLIGAVRMRDLTPEVLDRWVTDLVAVGDRGKPRLGSTSARTVRKVLSMALGEAVERGRLPRNPVQRTQPPRAERGRKKLGWTLEEAHKFLEQVSTHRLSAAFMLSLVTGLRRGELLALRWSDLDLPGRQLEVVQQLAVERGRPGLKQLKTESSDRVVTFGDRTAAVLEQHRVTQDKEKALVGADWAHPDLVFTTPAGTWIDPNNFGRAMDVLIEKAGVPRITPKGMRHTAQSVGRVVVGDDKVMQERLGHSDMDITLNTYTHTVTEQHKRAGRQLDQVFAHASTPA